MWRSRRTTGSKCGVVIGCAFIACLTEVGRTEDTGADIEIVSRGIDNEYHVVIREADIKKTPGWKADAENPPVSARKSIALATRLRKSLLPDSKKYKWRLVSAELNPYWLPERWYWVVEFEGNRTDVSNETGLAPQLRVVILMDGTVLKAVLKPLSD